MTEDPQKAAACSAILRLMEPIAHIALAFGIGVGEVQALSELAFVTAARKEHQEAGDADPENVARITVRTGLPRATVMQLLSGRGYLDARNKPFINKAARVLRIWCSDEMYLDGAGVPAVLPVLGPPPSFQALVKLSPGEDLSRTILKELLRVGAVRRVRRTHVQVIRRTYPRVAWDESSIASLGEEIRDHLRAFVLALQGRDPPVFRRYITQGTLDQEHAAILERDFSGHFNANINSLQRALLPGTDSTRTSRGPKNRLSATVLILREPDVEPERKRTPDKSRQANRATANRRTRKKSR